MEFITDIGIINFLLFSVPGYFILLTAKFKVESEFGLAVQSIFWGLLFVTFMNYVTPVETYIKLFSNPYAGMVVFTLYGAIFGTFIRYTKGPLAELVKYGIKTLIHHNPFK
jgi:hypothetical protein